MGREDCSSAELRDAAKVIAEALSRLGRNFDPARDDDLDRAVQYVSDLMAADRAKYNEFVVALLRAEMLPAKGTAASEKPGHADPFVPVQVCAERTPTDDFLMDDEPSRGRLLTALETVARAKGIKGI